MSEYETHPEYGEPIIRAIPKTGDDPVLIYSEENAEQLRDDPGFEIEELQE